MDTSGFIERIRQKDYNRGAFVDLILSEPEYCELAIENMVSDKEIMVYYHCFEVLKEATQIKPQWFEHYFGVFQQLLSHQNSYHRDFGLTLIAKLISGVEALDFLNVSRDVFACLNDPKFMTAECCLKCLEEILTSRTEYTACIMDEVFRKGSFMNFSEKQRELIYSHVLKLSEVAYHNGYDRNQISDFILARKNSISPKTRKIANSLYKSLLS